MLPSLSAITHQAFPVYAQALGRVNQSLLTTLSNGFRVASQRTPSDVVTLGLLVKAGTRHETAANAGVANVWEKLAFKGTGNHSQSEIQRALEKIGATVTTQTNREHTAFYVDVLKKDVDTAVALLSEVIRNASITDAGLEAAKADALNAARAAEADVATVLLGHVHRQAFETDSLGNLQHGNADKLTTVSPQAVKDWVAEQYTAGNVVLVGAGDIDHSDLAQAGNKYFGSLPVAPKSAPRLYSRYVGGMVREFNEHLPYAHIAVGFRTDGWNSQHETALKALAHIYGSYTKEKGDTALTALARRLGLAKDINFAAPFLHSYEGIGLFGVRITAYPEADHAPQLSYIVSERFERNEDKHIHGGEVCNELLYEMIRPGIKTDEDELTRAKNALKAATLRKLTSTANTAEDLGAQVLFTGRHQPVEEYFHAIDNLSPRCLSAAVMAYLYDRDPTVAAVGNVVGLPNYHWWRRGSYLLRF